MPVTVGWNDPEKTLTRVHFRGSITFDEIIAAWKQEVALLRSVSYPVYSMNVFEDMPLFVRGLNLRALREFAQATHIENLQLTVQVCDNPLVRTALARVMPRLHQEHHVVPTVEEAYALVHAYKLQLASDSE